MSDRTHHVVLRFRLPPVLLLHAEPGLWPRSPRGGDLVLLADGAVTVTSQDHHESYGVDQVRRVALQWLRATVRNAPPTSIAATLSSPSLRRRRGPDGHEVYAIVIGAKVSIARTDERPAAIGEAEGSLIGDTREQAPLRAVRSA
jgi:hypothetical protein